MLIKKPTVDRIAIVDNGLLVGKTETGLIIAESTQNISVRKGMVVGVGPDCKQVKEGDIVCYMSNKGIQVRVFEDVYLIMREGDLEFIANEEDIKNLPVAPPQS